MTMLFFPSCKAKANLPNASLKLRHYMAQRYQPEQVGCCRADHRKLTGQDMAVVLCNNCAAICQESSAAGGVTFLWELIDGDESFTFPDYGGVGMAVQDCWRSYENRGEQEAVRSLLAKMNIVCQEQEENFEKTRFCGVSLLEPCLAGNAKLAPKRYVEKGSDMFNPCTQEEQARSMRLHCGHIAADKVVCYCMSCVQGIKLGGKEGVHLLELLFPE